MTKKSPGTLSSGSRSKLLMSILPLMVVVCILQKGIDPGVKELRVNQNTPVGIPTEFILGPLLGLQQAVAGLLWVRADQFFHSGDYDAILPIVRMVTWLDPNQLDVYITGSWHLAYNFTDANERSDRRYIPAAQKLLEEGNQNNPKPFDLTFELGWQNTDKIKDYERAEKWFRDCTTRFAPNDKNELVNPPPMFVWHQLAHSLVRQGRVDESVEVWRKVLALSEEKLKKNTEDFSAKSVRDSERHNLELTLKRKFARTQHEIDWDIDKTTTKSIDPVTGEPSPKDAYLYTSGPNVGQPKPPAVAKPWDCAFDVKPSFPAPKVLDIKGTFNVGDGARVGIKLHDEDYRNKQLQTFTFNVDQSQTLMQDAHSVRDGQFGRKIDMSKDPKMYGFTREYYYLVFDFNPRGTSPFIQDRFGWSGEGMTDKKYAYEIESGNGKAPKLRILRKVFKISRDQIFGRKPVTDADVVSNEVYEKLMKTDPKGKSDAGSGN